MDVVSSVGDVMFWEQESVCREHKCVRVVCSLCLPPGGKTEDFISAAKLFYRAKRQVKVPTYLVPATQKVGVTDPVLFSASRLAKRLSNGAAG